MRPTLLSSQRLADASLLLPELARLGGDLPVALPLDGPGAQVRLLEGVAAVISAASRGPEPGSCSSTTCTRRTRRPSAISYLGRRLRAVRCCCCWPGAASESRQATGYVASRLTCRATDARRS